MYFLITVNTLTAQNLDSNFLTTITQSIYSPNFDNAQKKLDHFIQKNNIKISSMNRSKTSNISTFYLNYELKNQFDSLTQAIGYSNSKNIQTTNYSSQIIEVETEIEYLKQRKDEYKKEIELKKNRNETYEALWNEVRRIDGVIHQQEKRLSN